MKCCSVSQCTSRNSKSLALHNFPNDPRLIKEWVRILEIGKPISKYMYVCGLHFKANDYFLAGQPTSRRYLKKGAIPSQKIPIIKHQAMPNTAKLGKKLLQAQQAEQVVAVEDITIKEEPFLQTLAEEIEADEESSTGNCEFELREEQEEVSLNFAFENCGENRVSETTSLVSADHRYCSVGVKSEEENSIAFDLEVDPLAIKQEPEILLKVESDTEEPHLAVCSKQRAFESAAGHETTKHVAGDRKSYKPTRTGLYGKFGATFAWDLCLETFKTKQELKQYLAVKREGRPFHCNVCSKRFRLKSHLMIHKLCHHEEHHFSCSLCSASLKTKQGLQVHQAMHNGERPFKCSTCSKSYKLSSHLARHILTHAGDNPPVCKVCEKPFATKRELRRHRLTQFPKEPLVSCDVCSKKCMCKRSTLMHQQIHIRK